MPGTAKILCWNLTRISFFKQVVGQFFLSVYLLSALLSHLESFFFAARCFFNVALCLVYCYNL